MCSSGCKLDAVDLHVMRLLEVGEKTLTCGNMQAGGWRNVPRTIVCRMVVGMEMTGAAECGLRLPLLVRARRATSAAAEDCLLLLVWVGGRPREVERSNTRTLTPPAALPIAHVAHFQSRHSCHSFVR